MAALHDNPGGRRGRLLTVGLAALGAVTGLWAAAWLAGGGRPDDAVIIELDGAPERSPPQVGDVLRVLTWNIHYGAGPTLEMGRVTSREHVEQYLDAIARTIVEHDVDVVALQEVDRRSTRGHGIDQLAHLQARTGMRYAAWSSTWKAGWVPYPGLDPPQAHRTRVVGTGPCSVATRWSSPSAPPCPSPPTTGGSTTGSTSIAPCPPCSCPWRAAGGSPSSTRTSRPSTWRTRPARPTASPSASRRPRAMWCC